MRHMAVDRYLKSNRRFAENESYPDMTALYQALDRDEYDIIYGIDDSEFSLSLSKKANSKIQSNPDKINIIYECSCNHPRKHRHHPNYDEPYTVLLLCPSCHRKEHARLHRWHEPAYELLADQSATNSTTPAVNAPAEDRGDCSTRYLGITISSASEYEIQSNDIHQHLPQEHRML
jgi:hypothetical protein